MVKQWHTTLLLLTLCLLLTACGSTGRTDVADAEASLPAHSLTDFAGRQVSFTSVPQHIVALGNGEANIVMALGGALVGKPTSRDSSAILTGTEEVMQIGTAHEVDLEKLAYLKADVVLGNTQMNAKDIPSIEGIGAKMVLTSANSVADITKQISLFGQMLNKVPEANKLTADIEAGIKDAAAAATNDKPRVLLVYGAPGTYMAALPNSLGGNMLELAGGANIAADYPALQSYPQYATLNTERVMEANPQIILIMTHGNGEEVQKGFEQEMRQNAAWSSINAVVHNRVRVLPADLFGTNPGTRVTEALQLLVSQFAELESQ